MERIGRIFKFMKENALECIVIKDVYTIRYLTGFTGDSSLLYADDRIAVLITDGRYTEQARSELKYCRVMEYKANHNNSIWEAVAGLTGSHLKMGFDGNVFSYEDARALREQLPQTVEMISVDLRGLRLVKDERELENLWQAHKIADAAFERLLKEIKSGMTERNWQPAWNTICAAWVRKGFPSTPSWPRAIAARCLTGRQRTRPLK